MRKFTKIDNVVERKIRNSRILVPLENSNSRIDSVYTLNQMAGFIWDQAVAGLSDDDIIALIVRDFAVAEEQARTDATKVLDELVSVGALAAV